MARVVHRRSIADSETRNQIQSTPMYRDTHPPGHCAGDVILNRYMPNATEAEWEVARERLRELAELVGRSGKLLAIEKERKEAGDASS